MTRQGSSLLGRDLVGSSVNSARTAGMLGTCLTLKKMLCKECMCDVEERLLGEGDGGSGWAGTHWRPGGTGWERSKHQGCRQ